jgi:hypothetical protein
MAGSRKKRSARVSSAAVGSTTARHLSDAAERLAEMEQADRPSAPQIGSRQLAERFLGACRRVYQTAMTFAEEHYPPHDFMDWRDKWETALDPDQRQLWDRMVDERDRHEHGEGAELIDHPIQLPIRPPPRRQSSRLLILGIDWRAQPPSFKGGVRFKLYPDEPISEVRSRYLALCRRFAEDFQKFFPA